MLESEYDALVEQDECEARDTELEKLDQALETLRGKPVFAPADLAIAGAIVTQSVRSLG